MNRPMFPRLVFRVHLHVRTEAAAAVSSGAPKRRSTPKRFKKSFSKIAWLTGAVWLTCVAPVAAGSELETVRAKVRAKYPSVSQISTAKLAAWLADTNRPSPVLLDVRTEAEYAVSHLPGARRADLRVSPPQIAKALEPGRPVVIYCSVGYRSSQMAERLQ